MENLNRKFQIDFYRIPVKSEFSLNGNRWLKRSKTTAEIVKPEEYSGIWFYFRKSTKCIIFKNQGNFH